MRAAVSCGLATVDGLCDGFREIDELLPVVLRAEVELQAPTKA